MLFGPYLSKMRVELAFKRLVKENEMYPNTSLNQAGFGKLKDVKRVGSNRQR